MLKCDGVNPSRAGGALEFRRDRKDGISRDVEGDEVRDDVVFLQCRDVRRPCVRVLRREDLLDREAGLGVDVIALEDAASVPCGDESHSLAQLTLEDKARVRFADLFISHLSPRPTDERFAGADCVLHQHIEATGRPLLQPGFDTSSYIPRPLRLGRALEDDGDEHNKPLRVPFPALNALELGGHPLEEEASDSPIGSGVSLGWEADHFPPVSLPYRIVRDAPIEMCSIVLANVVTIYCLDLLIYGVQL